VKTITYSRGPHSFAWRNAHPEFFRRREPRLRPEKYRLLRVTTEYYCAGALWVKRSGVWACEKSAPILNWMRFKSASEVHLELLRLEAKFEWLEITDGKAELQQEFKQ
jgi:hypothetical protein